MPRVSEERRAALRKFCELAERGQSTLGRVAVGTGDILGVLEDLDAAEKRERITAKALEDMLRECRNQGDKHRQAVAAISVRREREILELQTTCCCCGKPRGDDPVDRHGNAWCDDCALAALLAAAGGEERGADGAATVLWGPPSPDPTHPGRAVRFGMANGANVPDEGAGG